MEKISIINLIIVAILSTTYALLLPLDYKATATVMIPPDTSIGIWRINKFAWG